MMPLFKNKKKKFPDSIYYELDTELIRARVREQTSFYYPLAEADRDKAMAWGIRKRISIEPDYITDGVVYYKFYGYSFDY